MTTPTRVISIPLFNWIRNYSCDFTLNLQSAKRDFYAVKQRPHLLLIYKRIPLYQQILRSSRIQVAFDMPMNIRAARFFSG